MKRCGLLGRNIQYSLSPKIHNEYYIKNNLPFTYELFDVGQQELEDFMVNCYENKIIGFNITIPYKEAVLDFLDELKYPSDKIGAVNTVKIAEDGKKIGYNTDYFGFIESLMENDIDVKNKRALIVGSGGSAKAVYIALKDLKAKNISVLCRRIEKAGMFFMDADIIKYHNISLNKYDLVINCTPLGNINFKGKPIELLDYNEDLIVYDLNYIPEKSEFIMDAESKGLKAINGKSMLINQAIHSINIWKELI
ncbi:shikimate dehydrogenase [Clostridium polynesiense]|uniref:shikimate dehydrogenase n=1 Tax=Clostridium polynesiense TaxID=1325933 RepID=UPI00058C2FB0|nr:shikimate dehydrogenase [Clostridium polynesiense]